MRPKKEAGITTVLLIDSDLGFTFWLGQALAVVGFNALPARNTCAAMDLIRECKLSVIDLLVIDPFIPDGLSFTIELRQQYSGLKVVAALPEGVEEADIPFGFEGVMPKPAVCNEAAKSEWIHLIQRLSASVVVSWPTST